LLKINNPLFNLIHEHSAPVVSNSDSNFMSKNKLI
jgi:hypothetical protein